MIAEYNKETKEMQLPEHLAAIVQSSNDGIISISIDGIINYWNNGAQQLFGYSSDEVLGKSIDILATAKTDEHKNILEKYISGKKLENFETKRITKDGSVIDVSLTISPIFDNNKIIIGFSTIARDVTIRTQYSQYPKSLIEASRDPLVTLGIEGMITDMNQAAVNIIGIDREKLIGSDFFEYFTEPQKARELYKEVVTKGFVSDSPLTIRHKEGKFADVLFSGLVYKDGRGNVLRVVIIARDITAQKLLSKYSLNIIEASRDPLVTISTEGKITGTNQATVNYTGIEREKLIGSDFLDYFTEPLKAREVYKEIFAKGSVADFPLTLLHKNGKLTDVLFNGSVYKDDRGNVQGVVVVARDITAQKIFSKYSLSLIEASRDPLVTISTEGKITGINQATVNYTGIEREKLIGSDFLDYFTEPLKAREVYKEIFSKGSVADFPLTLQHKSGKLTDVLFNGSVYKDDRGNVLGVVVVARDVTAQKLLYKYSLSLIEASRDPLVTISIEGKITDTNQATVNYTGIEREKLIGSDFLDYFTEPKKAREVYKEVFAKGFVADFPLTLQHKSGKLTDVLFNGSVYKDDRANVLGVVVVARDITAQKIFSKYSLSLIEASRDPLVTISTEGKITGINQATVNYTGIEREKLIGSDFLDYFTEPLKAREVYKEIFAKGFVADFPLILRHKNGKLTDVSFNGSVYKDDRGNVLGVVVVARDVTGDKIAEEKLKQKSKELEKSNKELTNSEQQIQSIFDGAPDAVIVINNESSIIKWNHKAEKLFGWNELEVLRKPLYEFIIPERYRERHKAGMNHYLETGEGPVLNKDIEIEAINKKGNEFSVLLSISPVDIKDEKLFIGFVRDITEKKKAEAELNKKSEELERSNKELEQFAYIASHDLQAPLRMVSSYLQLLEKKYKDKLDKDAHDFINFAVDGSNRMRTLIASLLDYSRINRVKPFEDIKLNELLKEVLGDLKTDIVANKAVITIEPLPDIFGDKVLIGELFQNLISNAVKFKGERNPEILISGKKNNDEYLFFVKDNGIGIQKEYASKLFVIFQRLNTQEQYPGTGIGLAVCKKIVERHGGKIWFESEFGKGTTFYFTIKEKVENPNVEIPKEERPKEEKLIYEKPKEENLKSKGQ